MAPAIQALIDVRNDPAFDSKVCINCGGLIGCEYCPAVRTAEPRDDGDVYISVVLRVEDEKEARLWAAYVEYCVRNRSTRTDRKIEFLGYSIDSP